MCCASEDRMQFEERMRAAVDVNGSNWDIM